MQTYSDEYLDYWGDIYTANPALHRRGILFETFLQAPDELLAAVVNGTALPLQEGEDFYPLLPEQQLIRDRLAMDEIADYLEQQLAREHVLTCRDGRLIERLRHHAFPNRDRMRRIA